MINKAKSLCNSYRCLLRNECTRARPSKLLTKEIGVSRYSVLSNGWEQLVNKMRCLWNVQWSFMLPKIIAELIMNYNSQCVCLHNVRYTIIFLYETFLYHQNKLINRSSSNSKVITKDCAERNYLFKLVIALFLLLWSNKETCWWAMSNAYYE